MLFSRFVVAGCVLLLASCAFAISNVPVSGGDFDIEQRCRAFTAVSDFDATNPSVCSSGGPPPEPPHVVWIENWKVAGFIDERLVSDGEGTFTRVFTGVGTETISTIRAPVCSPLDCDNIKFDLDLTITGAQFPPAASGLGWEGQYPLTGPGNLPSTPKKELVFYTAAFANRRECQCNSIQDCNANGSPQDVASDYWEYFTSPTNNQVRGFLRGVSGTYAAGAEIEITLFNVEPGGTDYTKVPQRGYGANNKNIRDGIAFWFSWKVNSNTNNAIFRLPEGNGWQSTFNFNAQVKGDVNMEFDCSPPVVDVCVDLVDGFECDKPHEDLAGPCLEFVTSTSTFRATGDHLIHTPHQGWRLIRELKVGDVLRSGIIESIKDAYCHALNSCQTEDRRFTAFGEVFAQNALITPDNYKTMLIH